MNDRHEAARAVIRQLGVGAHWKTLVDADMPSALKQLTCDMLDAYERVDLEWLLAHCDPEILITQPAEFPEARRYHGPDGLVQSLLDWPRDWEDFRIEPRRLFAAGADHLLFDAVHHGRSRAVGLEVEAQIVFVLRIRGGLVTRWQMFLSMDDAAAAIRSA